MIIKQGGLYGYYWINKWTIQMCGKAFCWKSGTAVEKANAFDKQKGFVWQNDWTSKKV